jgi:diaminopimelate decarboxylase
VPRTVARRADYLEVASGGEVAHAAAAVPGARLACGGPGKSPAELAAAVRAGVARFQVGKPARAAAALAAVRTADVLLRVNLPAEAPGGRSGAALVMGGGPLPFGMDPGLVDQCAHWLAGGSAEAGAIRLGGLHAHLASGPGAADLLGSARRVLGYGRQWCARHGVRDPEFNLGGGMAVDYRRPGARFDWAG